MKIKPFSHFAKLYLSKKDYQLIMSENEICEIYHPCLTHGMFLGSHHFTHVLKYVKVNWVVLCLHHSVGSSSSSISGFV